MYKIKEYYKQSFNIIRNNKKIIYIVAVLYFVSLLTGIFNYGASYQGFTPTEIKEGYYQTMKETNFHDNFIGNFAKMFSHNLIASLFTIGGGVLLGIIPIFLIIDGAISNSYSLVAFTIDENFLTSILLFLPHSIFEIPAFILSSAFGLIIFLSLFKKGRKISNLFNSVKESLIVFLFLVFPLLLIAGIIESLLIITYWF